MRIRPSSILALLLSTGASAEQNGWQIFSERFVATAHAQETDWQKVDETLGRKPAVTGDANIHGTPFPGSGHIAVGYHRQEIGWRRPSVGALS